MVSSITEIRDELHQNQAKIIANNSHGNIYAIMTINEKPFNIYMIETVDNDIVFTGAFDTRKNNMGIITLSNLESLSLFGKLIKFDFSWIQ